jgi:uncharacterized protein (DUF1501 family)
MLLTRRHLLGLGAGALAFPTRALAAPSASTRRFVFIHCVGGWDAPFVFAPELLGRVDHEPEATAAEAMGLPFVDHPERSTVRQFFENYGDRSAILNGMSVPSITHERCRRIALTGFGDGAYDDWPSILAANASDSPLLPHLVMAGSAFNAQYGDQVVRVGDNGQLPKLLSGQALSERDQGAITPTSEAIEDAYMAQRLGSLAAMATSPAEADFYSRYATALQAQERLQSLGSDLDLDPTYAGCERDIAADASTLFDCFERGLTRCGMIAYEGWCAEGWDSHQQIERQSLHFREFFGYLNRIMQDLDGRTAFEGGPMRDQVTFVLFSEMGRAPTMNLYGGKDHWTTASAMLVGAGIRGGNRYGSLDEQARGAKIDLATGQASSSGESFSAQHLGATLLALGDVDPGRYIQAPPLTAAMEGF